MATAKPMFRRFSGDDELKWGNAGMKRFGGIRYLIFLVNTILFFRTPSIGLARGFKNVRQISAGGMHTCALDDEGVKCWGYTGYGLTHDPKNLVGTRRIAVGGGHACALDNDGVKCWGYNDSGQTDVPKNLVGVRQISAGGMHTCMLDGGGVKCWGYNGSGQLNGPKSRRR